MAILGVSAFYHDSAAAIVVDGDIVGAAQEERFTRRKHDRRFPRHAIQYCLAEAAIAATELTEVMFYESPSLKVRRQLATQVAAAPLGLGAMRGLLNGWRRQTPRARKAIEDGLSSIEPAVDWGSRMRTTEHHLSHAASAFYPSPFQRSAILTVDGVGEWTTISYGVGEGNRVRLMKEIHFPHSLGLLYSTFTAYLGFRADSGEYKVMGLAPYGEPIYAERILSTVVDAKADGSFRFDLRYFDYTRGTHMFSQALCELLGGPPRQAEEPLSQRHMDVAASIQRVLERILVRIARTVQRDTGMKFLCLAGGVSLNCVANREIQRAGLFDRIWVQPAAGDAGGALGAALLAHYRTHPRVRSRVSKDAMKGALLGPSFRPEFVRSELTRLGGVFTTPSTEMMIQSVAGWLASGKIVGWFQGRMEFGPRALGARSILADPRGAGTQRTLNLKIKFRESFRPFAPAVLEEAASEWFELEGDAPYMLVVADVAASKLVPLTRDEASRRGLDALPVVRSEIPAVTHIDNSARVQTVSATTNPRFHALLSRFATVTGCPVLVNTSFNVRGEPIVCSPEDAFRCFMGTGIDVLVIEDCVLIKQRQNPSLGKDYKNVVPAD